MIPPKAAGVAAYRAMLKHDKHIVELIERVDKLERWARELELQVRELERWRGPYIPHKGLPEWACMATVYPYRPA